MKIKFEELEFLTTKALIELKKKIDSILIERGETRSVAAVAGKIDFLTKQTIIGDGLVSDKYFIDMINNSTFMKNWHKIRFNNQMNKYDYILDVREEYSLKYKSGYNFRDTMHRQLVKILEDAGYDINRDIKKINADSIDMPEPKKSQLKRYQALIRK